MGRKTILIVYSASIFPIVMASQDRVFNMIKRLAKDHIVDFAFIDRGNNDLKLNMDGLQGICRKIIPIPALNPYGRKIKRILLGIMIRILKILTGLPVSYLYQSQKKYKSFLRKMIIENNYDIVQIEYCYMSSVFRDIEGEIFKVVDTHGIAYKDEYLNIKKKRGNKISISQNREIEKIKKLESSILSSADLNIAITAIDIDDLVDLSPNVNHIIIPIGQDLGRFNNYELNTELNTILFYGSMGGVQNIYAFKRFWNNIYPIINQRIMDLKVLVVGANPPSEIKKLHDGKNIVVTGFVEDTRPYLSRSSVMILPLEIGVGFRGRTIEVMAMGIPIVGTHNALDNLGLQNGKQGFITDSDMEMADYLCKILTDNLLSKQMSLECKKFVKAFDLEETYGKLSKYYFNLVCN
jgi:glycosyltransferase involved in cell wall biosynthesis